jgi:hypothetical protein
MGTIKGKNFNVGSTTIKGIIENMRRIEFHQKKAALLTECVLSQCADILEIKNDVNAQTARKS